MRDDILERPGMLDWRGGHGIILDVETVRADESSDACERVLTGDGEYHFIRDGASLAV